MPILWYNARNKVPQAFEFQVKHPKENTTFLNFSCFFYTAITILWIVHFVFSLENGTLEACFPIKKTKIDNSQSGYTSVEKTGKIKKNIFCQWFKSFCSIVKKEIYSEKPWDQPICQMNKKECFFKLSVFRKTSL